MLIKWGVGLGIHLRQRREGRGLGLGSNRTGSPFVEVLQLDSGSFAMVMLTTKWHEDLVGKDREGGDKLIGIDHSNAV